MDELSNRQKTALAALLQSETIAEAADRAKMSRTTMYAFLKEPKFAAAYAELQRKRLIERAEQAESDRQAACDAIREIATDQNQSAVARLKACELIIASADKAIQAAQAAMEAETDPFAEHFRTL